MKKHFSQLPDLLPYPRMLKAKISTVHSNLIESVSKDFDGSQRQKNDIMKCLNSISYMFVSGDTFPDDWSSDDPMKNCPIVDEDTCKTAIGDLYVSTYDVDWDIDIRNSDNIRSNSDAYSDTEIKPVVQNMTPKSDLYIQPPSVPRFDYHKKYAVKVIGEDVYAIYHSIPEIPTKQNEISVTTDVSKMTTSDLMKLYPNRVIRTRPATMYQPVENIFLHKVLGNVLPIGDFSKDELIDNVVKYPHIFKLQKEVDGVAVNFYSTVEIDGQLHSISDVWNELPESKLIPYSVDYIKEYVVRRYLLERDLRGVDHRYKMYGELDPFLTLFAPSEFYADLGYDVEDLAKKCVESRVAYKRSRNPVLRRID